MSKETQFGTLCPGCRQMIAFTEYHARHCKNLMTALPQKKRKRKRRGK